MSFVLLGSDACRGIDACRMGVFYLLLLCYGICKLYFFDGLSIRVLTLAGGNVLGHRQKRIGRHGPQPLAACMEIFGSE